jgi:hypothetical protein
MFTYFPLWFNIYLGIGIFWWFIGALYWFAMVIKDPENIVKFTLKVFFRGPFFILLWPAFLLLSMCFED